MGLGKRKDDGNFLPIAKYDARCGRISLQDRVHGPDGKWQTKQRDITDTFKAAFDLENLLRGWLFFRRVRHRTWCWCRPARIPATRRPRTTGKASASSS